MKIHPHQNIHTHKVSEQWGQKEEATNVQKEKIEHKGKESDWLWTEFFSSTTTKSQNIEELTVSKYWGRIISNLEFSTQTTHSVLR